MTSSLHVRAACAWAALAVGVALTAAACRGSTGGELFEIEAYAAGPEAAAGGSYRFVTPRGWEVTLDKATLHVGAVYLNQSVPTSVASDTTCLLAGVYVAQVTSGLDVDALDPTPQPFPGVGVATSERARTAELWLSGGDLFADDDATVVADVAGSATKDGETLPFAGTITIGQNRAVPPEDPAQPGARPLCKQRVVSPIEVDLALREGDALLVRVDPAGWFANVDFGALSPDDGTYRFADDSSDQPSRNLYGGVRANAGVYGFEVVREGGAP